MITIHLTGQSEKIAPYNPWEMQYAPLYHQWRTYDALRDPDVHLVANSHNTGTGKTRASLLHLFTLDEQGGAKNVLFVAPTNALLTQHAQDIQEFVTEHHLNFVMRRITAAETRELSYWLEEQGDYKTVRPAEALMRLIRNYREFDPTAQERKGLILVVNPDIFYYALMFQYGAHDQRNLFEQFFGAFQYIVIDEFHYYDQKQLAFFLLFFAMSQQLGYFEYAQRKVCLLTATPTTVVRRFLGQLFGEKWRLIAPETEPLESADYPTIPTLTPLTLTITNQPLLEWGERNRAVLAQWLTGDGLDGAIISNSLKRINRLYDSLRGMFSAETVHRSMRRITGPESETARQTATLIPLILATPTVDIGYNFNKPHKKRQNIDFIICEARFRDDLIQRIGRAGRILAASDKDGHSHATALVPENALDLFRPHDGQTLTRAAFKALLDNAGDMLPEKHNLTGYLQTWAITEVFYPVYRLERLIARREVLDALEALYQQLLTLFDVRQHGAQKWQLEQYFRNFFYREQWLREGGEIRPNKQSAQNLRDWLYHKYKECYSPSDTLHHLQAEGLDPDDIAAVQYFIRSQVALSRSLFNFRDSFSGPTAVIYDADRRFSSEPINAYDVLHLIADYDIDWYPSRAAFMREHGSTDRTGDFYWRIRAHRQQSLYLSLHLNQREFAFEEWEKEWVGRPVALDGLKLEAQLAGQLFPIDSRIRNALSEQFTPILLVPAELGGHAWRRLGHTPIYHRQLTIDFADRERVEYLAYLGKSAWLAYPELRSAFRLRERMQDDPIIIG